MGRIATPYQEFQLPKTFLPGYRQGDYESVEQMWQKHVSYERYKTVTTGTKILRWNIITIALDKGLLPIEL
jgi:hypothetical protein